MLRRQLRMGELAEYCDAEFTMRCAPHYPHVQHLNSTCELDCKVDQNNAQHSPGLTLDVTNTILPSMASVRMAEYT
jgi:hypothetical protein